MARYLLLLLMLVPSCASMQRGSSKIAQRSPEQLAAFIQSHEQQIAAGDKATRARLDALCGQHDCHTSRLFWFTDLEEAKARARRENKPILSLRMLGQLTDPQSCANSRFFRSVLYADPAISALLRDHFVLHWKEVRAVPKVTIDFGDGRTMRRTLTGNSAHYVLDANGRPVDVLPGLISPQVFRELLVQDRELVRELARSPETTRMTVLAQWHHAKLGALVAYWTRLLRQHDIQVGKLSRALDEALVELDAITRGAGYWRIAQQAQLSHSVVERISARFPPALRANELTTAKAITETPLLRSLYVVRTTIGRDSIENELRLRGRVHTWFKGDEMAKYDVAALDHRVYAELFLAPLDDPWYGLMPPEEMRALDDCGTIQGLPSAKR